MSLLLKLNQVVTRHAELQAALSAGTLDGQKFVAASKEYADLGPLVEAVNEWHKAERELKDTEAMASDPDMKAMAEEEAAELRKRLPELERTVKRMLLPKDAADEKNAILEIRAGTGGDEAALFAADLFRMYQRYAAEQGLEVRDHGAVRHRHRRLSRGDRHGHGPQRVRPPQVRDRASIACSACRRPRPRAASTPRRRRWRCCRRPRRSTSRSTRRTCASTCSAPPARAASRSTRPTRRCASPISRPASSSASRTRRASTRTAPRR